MHQVLNILLIFISTISYTQESKKIEVFTFNSKENWKIGYVNENNEVIIKPQYTSGTYFKENGFAVVSKKFDDVEKFAIIDLKGNYLITFEERYELISLENEYKNWILVVKNGKWGYINYEKEIIIPLEYEHLGDFYGGLAFAKKNGKYGFIDINNKIIIDFEFDWTLNFGGIQPDGLRYVRVEKENKIGYINNKGKLVVPYLYDFAYPFYNGIAIVKKDEKYGCINTKGDIIIPFNFEFIYNSGKIIKTRKEFISDIEYYYNKKGKFIGTGATTKK